MILPASAITAFAFTIDFAIPHEMGLRGVILIAALGLDALLGEPPWLWRFLPHPVVLFGRAIVAFEKRLNRRNVGGRTRRWRGFVAIIMLVLAALATGGGIMAVAGLGGAGLTAGAELLIVAILLAGRSLDDHVRAVADALPEGGGSLDQARRAVSMIVGRNPESLDAPAIARASIETTAENLSDGVIAPALFYLAFGLPGIIAYKMINTADSMTGYKSRRYFAYGWGAARVDDLANIIPARLTGILIALAKPQGAFHAIRVMMRDAPKHRSPNAGWPEAAMATQLGVSLAGPRQYGQRMSTDAPMHGEGRRDANADDIRQGLGLMWRAIGLFAVLLAGLVAVVAPLTGI